MVICGELPPLKDLAISAKLGSSIHLGVMGLSSGVFTHWLEMIEIPGIWLETVKVSAIGGMVSFECPILLVKEKEPCRQALLHPLQLHSHVVSGSAMFEGSRGSHPHPMG